MFIRVRNFLAPPVFEDTDANFTARNLNVILLSALAGITLTILRYIALGRIWSGSTGQILLSGGLTIGLCYVLLRQRRIVAGSLLTVAVLTLMPFLMMVEGDGIHDTAIMLLPVVVIVASMLFGWRGLSVYSVIVALAFGALVRLEIRGFLVTPSNHPVTNSDFTDALTILTVAAGMSGLLAVSVRHTLRRLNNELRQREMAEKNIIQRDTILQATAFAAQAFLQGARWEENIQIVLAKFGEATQASHVYIFENHTLPDGTAVTSHRYEWVAPHAKTEIHNPEFQNVPLQGVVMDRWYQLLSSGQAYIGYDETMPPDEADYLRERGVLSIVDVPIFVGGKWWGIIGFDDTEKTHKWSPAEVEALKAAASVISATIENARLFQEVKQRAERMVALNEIELAITSTLDLDQIFRALFEKCRNLLSIDTFYIALYHETTYELTTPLYFDSGEYKNLPPRDIRANPGLSGYVITSRQTLYVSDISTQQAIDKYKVIFTGGTPSHAYVGVPMFSQGQVIGLISMQNVQADAYSPEDIHFFETIAAQAAVAIENARLFREAKQRADEMALLYQIGLALASGENLYDALRALVKELRRWMTVDTFYVGLYDDQTDVISFPLYLTFEDDLKPPPRNLTDQPGLTKEVIDLRRTLYISDIGDPLEQARHNIVMIIKLDIRSYVGIPLMLENKIMGVMSVQSLQPKAYTDAQIHLLETLAAQLVITIEKARLFEAEQVAREQSDILRESMSIVVATLDESESVRQILAQLKRVVPYDQASVQLIHDGYLEVVGGEGLPQDKTGMRFEINDNEPALPILKGQVPFVLFKDIQVEVSAFNEISEDSDIHTWLAVPLKVKGKIFGLIALDGFLSGQFTERHAKLAVTYADQVAIALENARLFEQAQRRATQLETLNEIGHAVSSLHDLDTVLEIIHAQVRQIALTDAFYICLYDEQRGTISFPLMYDMNVRYNEPTLPLEPDTWIAQVIQSGQPFMLHRTDKELARPVERTLGNNDRISASILIVPLHLGDTISGVLSIQSYTMNAYTDETAQILIGIGHQAAIAIQNARLYTSLQVELAERKKTQLELEASNRELESLSYNIGHDMRSPVRALVGLSQMLQHTQGDRLDEEGRSELERIHLASKRLGQLIDGFLAFLRLSHSPLNKQTLSVVSLLAGLKERFTRENQDRDIQFVMDELPACEADPALLEQVWTHLIANAVKFTRPRPQARIELGSGEKEGERYYFIRDNGIGFDMKYVDKIFVIFQHLNRQEEYEGVGVGLAIVQRIIHRHGGRIWAEAEDGIGATFYFTL